MAVVLHKVVDGTGDEVVVDLSTTRLPNEFESMTEALIGIVADGYPDARLVLEDGAEGERERENDDETISNTTNNVDTNDNTEDNNDDAADVNTAWNQRPIHQLPPYCLTWILASRSEAKGLCKRLAEVLETRDARATKSRKPRGIKPGKNRRSGGYGIG